MGAWGEGLGREPLPTRRKGAAAKMFANGIWGMASNKLRGFLRAGSLAWRAA